MAAAVRAMRKQIDNWLEKACLGQATPEDAAKGMQQAATSIYKP